MNATIESNGELLFVYIAGEIDHHSAKPLREQIDNAVILHRPKHLVLDFQHVSFMDSSGVGLVLGRYRLMQQYRGTVELRHVSGQTKRMMQMSGVCSVAEIKEG